MNNAWNSIKSWDQSLGDVTRLCLFAAASCFLVGGAFLLADYFVPLAPRGVAILAVGGFFFIHGLFELARQWWQSITPSDKTLQFSHTSEHAESCRS